MSDREYQRAWRADRAKGIPYLVDAEPFRTWAREAWKTMTLGEMSRVTGLAPSTLRKVMFGHSAKLRVRTAGAIAALHLIERTG